MQNCDHLRAVTFSTSWLAMIYFFIMDNGHISVIVSECKEKWKNLRAVFIQHMKPATSGSGTKKSYTILQKLCKLLFYTLRL